MNEKSLISVIIPVYNAEKYLAETVESVLAQTYRPIEIIIVDDGSTDGNRKIAQRFGRPVCYSFKSHQGLGAARNHGITMARGAFCAFLDADDLWVENKLTRQIAVFRDKLCTGDAACKDTEHSTPPSQMDYSLSDQASFGP
jgi:glycosyltransferase involved in cell wall biosynthesis